MNLKDHFRRVKDTATDIKEPFVHVISVEGDENGWKGGSVAEVSRDNAAKLIVNGSHRIASPDETAAFRADSERRAREIQLAEARKYASLISGGRLLADSLEAPKTTEAKQAAEQKGSESKSSESKPKADPAK